MPVHLYGLSYSPWTERARWALDHHRVAYRYHEHVPMLGEPLLRARAKVRSGQKASVPLLVDGDERFMDSLDIMVRADRGASRPLISNLAETRALAAEVDRALNAARARLTGRLLADREALTESATAAVPAFMASLAAPVAALGVKFIARKHGAQRGQEARSVETLRSVLRDLRPLVDPSQPHTRDSLTATDILVATLLWAVRPVLAEHMRAGPAVRRAWATDELVEEFSALLDWRDALYRFVR
jgi:glutathione S-transferase